MSQHPARPLTGSITLPGDKSISHRALIVSSLARGESVLTGMNLGLDVRATASGLSALGAACHVDDRHHRVQVQGCGIARMVAPAAELACGNSGTTMRMLLGLCAAVPGTSVLVGDASLSRRPMRRVIDPLTEMGAHIEAMPGGTPPLEATGASLHGIDLDMTVASAQVKSAVLFAGLSAAGRTTVTEPAPSRDHTERMLAASGVTLAREPSAVAVEGPVQPSACDRDIPGDVSAAAFFGVGAALVPDSDISMRGVGLNPTRTAWIDALVRMGATVSVEQEEEWGGEPVGTVAVRASALTATEISGPEIPNLIDEIPILAVAATQAEGTTVISDAHELRVKESDRIATLASGLGSIGAHIEETPDGMIIHGPTPLHQGDPDPHGDHRAAMAFAVAGLVSTGKVRVPGWSCVDTSFPGFLAAMQQARGEER